jgi:predicted metal-binding protein
MVEECLKLGATGAEIVATESIRIKQEFRAPCEQNQCGHYGKNWMCPPGVGSLEECGKRVRRYSKGLLFQKVYPLKDSFDIEGMQEAHENFNLLIRQVRDSIPAKKEIDDYMILGVGACPVCKNCTYPRGEECVFPDKAVASVEAHGIDVKQLLEGHGMSYVNGANTVSYVGLLLYAEKA